jgi:hypothetical protein
VELSSARRFFGIALVASMCTTAALAVGILLFSDFDETAARILGTTAAISFFSLLALPGAVLLDRRALLPVAWASLALPAVAFLLVLAVLWVDWDDFPQALWKWALSVTVFAVAGAQAAATTGRRRADDSGAVRALYALGVALGLGLAVMSTVAAWAEIDATGYYRALGAVAVLAVLATLLQPVLRRLGGGEHGRSDVLTQVRVTLADGTRLDVEESGRDFADAVARAIRAAERRGGSVVRIERLGPA